MIAAHDGAKQSSSDRPIMGEEEVMRGRRETTARHKARETAIGEQCVNDSMCAVFVSNLILKIFFGSSLGEEREMKNAKRLGKKKGKFM